MRQLLLKIEQNVSASFDQSAAAITGWGHALPRAKVASEQLEQIHRLKAGSLVAATGVKTRYIADRLGAETQVALGLRAARVALERADCSASSLDLIIAASAVPQQLIPSTAPLYQQGLGLPDGGCQVLDVNTTCLSALSALEIAASDLESGRARRVCAGGACALACATSAKTSCCDAASPKTPGERTRRRGATSCTGGPTEALSPCLPGM